MGGQLVLRPYFGRGCFMKSAMVFGGSGSLENQPRLPPLAQPTADTAHTPSNTISASRRLRV